MNHILILCRSVTQAQRGGMLLSRSGITNRIFRSPAGLTERGCSYSIRITPEHLHHAMDLLRRGGTQPVKVVAQGPDGYTEVSAP